MTQNKFLLICAFTLVLASCSKPSVETKPTNTAPAETVREAQQLDSRQWLAGDHHIHSRYSVGWDRTQTPPAPIIAGDAIHPIPLNAKMARKFGLSWMVSTDHGGPNHSKVSLEMAYPELVQSRIEVPEVIQFYGMELNTPAADHSSLIIPHTSQEGEILKKLESGFDKWEAFPADKNRDTEAKMIEALTTMKALQNKPVLIANHPSRSATGYGVYGLDQPSELRAWNDTAPNIAVGMAGAPGHQAVALSNSKRFTEDKQRIRGWYKGYPTMGGFDQMTAKLGGFWDSMLGEGRHWWITANSDSHVHYTEGGVDFWPGEFSKTYVYADKQFDSILANLRAGHIFVTTGDLISELYVDVASKDQQAAIGETLEVKAGDQLTITIRVRDPDGNNAANENPGVKRVDLIVGEVTGRGQDINANSNPTTRVVQRFYKDNWVKQGDMLTMSETMTAAGSTYIRVRGTNTDQLEPEKDSPAENPWQDLWFYSNPVFVTSKQ